MVGRRLEVLASIGPQTSFDSSDIEARLGYTIISLNFDLKTTKEVFNDIAYRKRNY